MFDHAHGPVPVRITHARQLAREFFSLHGVALANAARLIGGNRAESRVQSLIEEIREGSGGLSIYTRHRIKRLNALLSLDTFDDIEGDLLDLSCAIDLSDPRIHDICLLSEALAELLLQIRQADAGRAATKSKGRQPMSVS